LLDERGMSRFNMWLVAFTFFIVLFDGYDITSMGFAAPAVMRSLHLTDQAAMGRILGASILGMLFGSPTFGYIGDRWGRRIAIISSILSFGVFSWLTALATTIPQFAILRFLTGLGLAGVMPNTVALVGEFAPLRYRASMIIVMFSGVAFGGGLPGPIAAWLVPKYGWQVLFTVGGVIPVAVAILCIFLLPESIKFLAIKKGRQQDAIKLLRRLRPDRTFGPETTFAIRDEGRQVTTLSPKHLFGDGLALITPLLWVLFITNLLGYMFLVSWTPALLSSIHLPISKAATASMLFQIGGAIGGWVLARPMDKYGLAPMKLISIVSIFAVASIGILGTRSEPLLMIVEFFAGFCILSLQFGVNAISAIIYPTSFRAVGSGWALTVGRMGSVFGPVIGGVLIAMHLSVPRLYMLAAIPFAVTTVACFLLSPLLAARLKNTGAAYDRTATAAVKS
jgi:AAHS family 4-hydroxybenzoate transporter-like MFS transporter